MMAPQASPVVLAISGPKDSGKTHLIESLVRVLHDEDIRLAVVKHDAHAHMKVDHEGKDSWRYAEAGAPRVGLVGPLGRVVIDRSRPFLQDDDAGAALRNLFDDVDLVIAEGFKDHALPRIKLIRTGEGPATHVAFEPTAVRDDEVNATTAEQLSLERCVQFIHRLLLGEQSPLGADAPVNRD